MVKTVLAAAWRRLPKRVRRLAVLAKEHRFTVAAAAVVFDERGRVLLLEHTFRPGNGWGVPGGFLLPGEQPEDAIRRELREEVGLELENVELIEVRALRVVKQIEILFRADARGEARPRTVEVASVSWCDPESLPAELNGEQRRHVARAASRSAPR
jgi:ADP-ribose pyrophosphatase YjhB (NUDIX family)